MKIITFNIGGTFTKYAVIFSNSKILEEGSFFTRALEIEPEEIIQNVINMITKLLKKYPGISAIGISLPGIIDSEKGTILKPITFIPGLVDLDLVKIISSHFKLPVVLMNDANAATLCEFEKGALQKTKNSVLVTIGTGIGAGIIINGKIFEGTDYSVGEVGKTIIDGLPWELNGSRRALLNNAQYIY